MQKITIKNSKGQNIAAVVHSREGETRKLAILCPGFLDSKDYHHLAGLGEALAKEGYTAVRFDPTGTWESEGDISEYNTTQYLQDIKSVKAYMFEEQKYDHLLMVGHSRGGRVSLIYSANDPEVSKVVGIMPSAISTPRDSAKQRRNDKWKEEGKMTSKRDVPGNEKEVREFTVPYSFLEDSMKYDTFEEASKIHVPILLITGEKDTIIPPEEVKEIYSNANEPKKFVIIPGIGHDYRHNLGEVEIVNKVIVDYLKSLK